ncbi:copper chaperone PCu(A)C [Amycolatopsis alkalitolerans]|uniref:Copper chaperone PCu(A)C n=1 Tax=Amycolatopsis alkalitolerans TaxID=2547244 RepID=A0A5C4M9G3_9PSEU|nr:copper chaperone PCu(A)C [Amycolatopsis alkalitolerans]TNC28014.1 copper chaperone PCu(A)C [Amycolatopsis alkalitolerans]
MRLQKRRALTSGVLGLGAALALAGCGAGQITQTDTMVPAVNGALATVGKISVRNAGLANTNSCQQAYPAGSNAPLTLTIGNAGAKDDELVSVSSPNASNVTIGGQKTVVGASSLVVGPADRPESGSGRTSASPTSSPTTGENGTLGRATIVLEGIKQVIWPGQMTPVTFVFRDAGPVTIQLPIDAPTKELPDCQTASQQAEAGN